VYNAPVLALLDWTHGSTALLAVFLLTLVPALELRASIPYGLLATDLPAWVVIAAALFANWLVAPLVYVGLQSVLKLCLRWPWFAQRWQRYSEQVLKKIHSSVETWGSWGLAIFIGIPLPGTGVYTGAVGAYLLGMSMRRFLVVSLAGVLLAAAIVALVVLTGSEAFAWLANRPGH
jgi:uncharacterized membrane protein